MVCVFDVGDIVDYELYNFLSPLYIFIYLYLPPPPPPTPKTISPRKKFVEKTKIDTSNTHIHECLISGPGTGTSIKSGGVTHYLQMIFFC
jgi:hypothetical protein